MGDLVMPVSRASHQRSRPPAFRSRKGCLTCRRRHLKCDESHPRCRRCQYDRSPCIWRKVGHSSPTASKREELWIEDERQLTAEPSIVDHCISTLSVDLLTHYLSSFHKYSFQLCAWTDLLTLPKRTTIPSILHFNGRYGSTRRVTNWANFYLIHLATGSLDDPLSTAMAAYVALYENDYVRAVGFYSMVLRTLRKRLKREDAQNLLNQEFLRIWSSVLILDAFEQRIGSHHSAAPHVEGATALCFIAASKFPIAHGEYAARRYPALRAIRKDMVSGQAQSRDVNLGDTTTRKSYILDPNAAGSCEVELSKSEMELPYYLMKLTRLNRAINLSVLNIDLDWPDFWHDDRQSVLGTLLNKCAECHCHVYPLVRDYHIALEIRTFSSPEAKTTFQNAYIRRYEAARQCIEQYKEMLASLRGAEYAVQESCSDKDFPFSPILYFANPQMVQPAAMASIFTIMLADFTTEEEHTEAIRHVAGIYAGRAYVEGLRLEGGSTPDLFIFAFFKPGKERQYFFDEIMRRKGEFASCLNSIWHTIDTRQAREQRSLDKSEILRIALYGFRQTMQNFIAKGQFAFPQLLGYGAEATAIGITMAPAKSRFSTSDEVAMRRSWPEVSYFTARINLARSFSKWNASRSSRAAAALYTPSHTKNVADMSDDTCLWDVEGQAPDLLYLATHDPAENTVMAEIDPTFKRLPDEDARQFFII